MTREEFVIAVVVFVLLAWDVYLMADSKKGNTISEIMRRLGAKSRLIPFLWGLLMGHWWWS